MNQFPADQALDEYYAACREATERPAPQTSRASYFGAVLAGPAVAFVVVGLAMLQPLSKPETGLSPWTYRSIRELNTELALPGETPQIRTQRKLTWLV